MSFEEGTSRNEQTRAAVRDADRERAQELFEELFFRRLLKEEFHKRYQLITFDKGKLTIFIQTQKRRFQSKISQFSNIE